MSPRLLAAIAALAVIVGGFAVGAATRKQATAADLLGQISVPAASLTYPVGWRVVSAAGPLLGAADAKTAAVEPSDVAGARLVVGELPGRSAADLPGLLAGYGPPEKVELVSLQGLEALRLSGVRDDAGGRVLDLQVVPVALPEGPALIVVACGAPPSAPSSFRKRCAALAAQTVPAGAPVPVALRPSPAYAQRLETALAGLRSARARGRTALRRQQLSAAQSASAASIATAYTSAAGAVAAAGPPAIAAKANTAIADALRAAAAAYARLAKAAGDGSPTAFTHAGQAVTRAEGGVESAVGGLAALGYGLASTG